MLFLVLVALVNVVLVVLRALLVTLHEKVSILLR